MKDNVVELGCVTRLEIPAERILRAATKKGLSAVVVVGFTEDGEEYFTASYPDGPNVLWCLERAKLRLLNMVDQ